MDLEEINDSIFQDPLKNTLPRKSKQYILRSSCVVSNPGMTPALPVAALGTWLVIRLLNVGAKAYNCG